MNRKSGCLSIIYLPVYQSAQWAFSKIGLDDYFLLIRVSFFLQKINSSPKGNSFKFPTATTEGLEAIALFAN
jgi:hypothetical protein